MVKRLDPPKRPLPHGLAYVWARPANLNGWSWCRIYHAGSHTADGHSPREFGPLYRFDPHSAPITDPALDDAERSVLYVGKNLTVALGEVFGESGVVEACPNYRVAIVQPIDSLVLLDIHVLGGAMKIGAVPSLATGSYSRCTTQEWARAIFEDRPLSGGHVDGIRYSAAYSNGEALALWGSAGKVGTVANAAGIIQDFALEEPAMFRRVAAAAWRLRLTTVRVPACRSCR